MSHPLDGTMKLKGDLLTVGGFRVEVVAGPDAGRGVAARDGTLTVGTAEGVALRLSDPAVSRYHLELEATAEGVVLRDLGSTNGTSLGGALVREARLVASTDLGLGHTHLRVVAGADQTVGQCGHRVRIEDVASVRLVEGEGRDSVSDLVPHLRPIPSSSAMTRSMTSSAPPPMDVRRESRK